MNELEVIKELLQNREDKTSFYWAIIVLLGLNLIAAFANFFQAIYLKNKESKQYRNQIREDRRLTILENLYNFLEELTYFDGKEGNDELLSKIASIEKFSSKNNIYISKEIRKSVSSTLDYYRSITTDFRKKDYSSESDFLSEFVRLFNK